MLVFVVPCMEAKLNLSSFMTGPEFRINNCQRFNSVYCIVKRERWVSYCMMLFIAEVMWLRGQWMSMEHWWQDTGRENRGKSKGKSDPGVAKRVGRGIALLFHDRGTRRGWVVSSTSRPTLPPGKNWYSFYRRLGGPQGRSGRTENLVPTGIRSRTVQPVVSRYTDWATRENGGTGRKPPHRQIRNGTGHEGPQGE